MAGLGLGMEEVEMQLEDDGDMEMEMQLEEARWPEVACPYCYEDHDVASLCTHLEEDHPYEPHAAPCPICAEKITRDMLNHITMQHGYLFKNGRRLHRFIIPESHALSFLSRDLRDAHLQALQCQMQRSHQKHQFLFQMIPQCLRRHLLSLGNQALTRPSPARKGNKSGNKLPTEQFLCKAWFSPLYLLTDRSNSPRSSLDGHSLTLICIEPQCSTRVGESNFVEREMCFWCPVLLSLQ